MNVNLIRAFTKDNRGGNMAGVVVDADLLTVEEMQEIATKVNVSETAFVRKSDKADFNIRFFTPTAEVDLCGHATIATFSYLAKILSPGIYTQETKAGILQIEIVPKEIVYMEQSTPVLSELIDADVLAKALTIPVEYIHRTQLLSHIVSTGLKDIFVPIDSREHINEIKPDFNLIKQISKDKDVIGLHVFTLDTLHKQSTAHVRNFAPLYGIDEESATGTSNGALASYLYFNKKLSQTDNLMFEQGYSMNEPSEILCKLIVEGETVTPWIGGRAALDKKLEINLLY